MLKYFSKICYENRKNEDRMRVYGGGEGWRKDVKKIEIRGNGRTYGASRADAIQKSPNFRKVWRTFQTVDALLRYFENELLNPRS